MIDPGTINLCVKLYSLADPKRGGSPEESHTAFIKLHELLKKHQISIDQVISAASASTRRRPDHPAYKKPEPPPSNGFDESRRKDKTQSWRDIPGFNSGPAATYEDSGIGRTWSIHGAYALWIFTPTVAKRYGLITDPSQYKFPGEPTDKQLNALFRFGVAPQSVRTKSAASRVIGLFMERKDRGLATVNQVCELARLSQIDIEQVADDHLTFASAAGFIQRAREHCPF